MSSVQVEGRNMGWYGKTFASLSDLKEQMLEEEDFRIRVFDNQSDVSIIAPHGGFIEAGTSHLAASIAGDCFNLFDFQGLLEEKPWRLHVTSTKFRDPYLNFLLYNSVAAVSIHGMGKTDSWRIWLGGLNGQLKLQIAAALSEEGFDLNFNPPKYKGTSKQNVVNLAKNQGVQLELPDDLLEAMFETKLRYSLSEPCPSISPLGVKFVNAVRRGLFLTLPGKLLPHNK